MRRSLLTTEPKKLEYYNGLLVHADSGLHGQAYRALKRHVSSGGSVLDAGAGAGAFSLRLADAGYAVTALDKDAGEWTLGDIPFLQIDIEKGIAGSVPGRFDAVCCLEVIEHVENQWNLLRELNGILKPGGCLLLSTPNIASFLSRLYFLRSGRFHQFFDQDLSYGHIHPIAPSLLTTMAARTGFEIIEIAPAGYLPVFDFSVIGLHSIFGNLMRGVTWWLAKNHKKGSCLLFVMKKKPNQPVLGEGKGSTSS
jgi:2-polyprenyl-3-methyl-5-hydroxy-6-metoxy-1,4-benzoquinol methylase